MINNQKVSRPGYEYLVDYMLGKVIQDLTFQFCQRFLKSPKDPTYPNLKLVEQTNGAGQYYGCTANRNASFRGGYWGSGAVVGSFKLILNNAPSSVSTDLGFRCAK